MSACALARAWSATWSAYASWSATWTACALRACASMSACALARAWSATWSASRACRATWTACALCARAITFSTPIQLVCHANISDSSSAFTYTNTRKANAGGTPREVPFWNTWTTLANLYRLSKRHCLQDGKAPFALTYFVQDKPDAACQISALIASMASNGP
eukprot:1143858-Pelagomonas_calceolata.AAC.6